MTKGKFSFRLSGTDGAARLGQITTPHGTAQTPMFMPVATQATVKGLTFDEVRNAGAETVLSNAYHLYLRPGVDRIRDAGGLHRFMGWAGPVLTDSGGYQAFSLGALRRINDNGILFRSHIDGSEHLFTPEVAIRNQQLIGADIIMCFDQCVFSAGDRSDVRAAMERTHRWARVCYDTHAATAYSGAQALFGIVQGGTIPEFRDESIELVTSIPFDGYAIGGLAVGETKEEMHRVTSQVCEGLPANKPRYLMGVGSPEDLVNGVALGVDMFDCVLPTRVARNGALFTPHRSHQHRQPALRGSGCAIGRDLRLLRLPTLFGSLLASSVQGRGNAGAANGVGTQPALRASPHGTDAGCNSRRAIC